MNTLNTIPQHLLKIVTRESRRPRSQRRHWRPHRRNDQWQLADLGLILVQPAEKHNWRKYSHWNSEPLVIVEKWSLLRRCSHPFRVKLAKQVILEVSQFDKPLVVHYVHLHLLFRPKMPLNARKVMVDGTWWIGGAAFLEYLCGKFGKPLAQFNLISTSTPSKNGNKRI